MLLLHSTPLCKDTCHIFLRALFTYSHHCANWYFKLDPFWLLFYKSTDECESTLQFEGQKLEKEVFCMDLALAGSPSHPPIDVL